MGSKKEVKLRALLDKILLRRAVVKEYEKATAALSASLQKSMEDEGIVNLDGANGGNALFSQSTSIKMPSTPKEVMEHFDVRTMAALLAGATVNKEKQVFLSRAFEDRDFSKVLSAGRSPRFTIKLPQSKEQKVMMSKAIKADEAELDKKVDALLEAYQGTEKMKAQPDNPKSEEVWEEQAAEKASKKKKKAAKKKKSKK